MSNDDDWFEQALRDADASDERSDIQSDEQSGADTPASTESNSGAENSQDETQTADERTDTATDSTTGFDDGTDTSTNGANDIGDPFATGDTDDGDNPFGDTGTDDDPFGGGGVFESGDAGGAFDDGGDGMFDEGFSDAMGGAGGGSDADFESEDFESDIPRLDIGVEGLDNMIQDGVPQRHLIVIIGGAGTGKTTFGLQYLYHGLQKEDTDRGVFITLEQTYDDIMDTANERGWEFDRHEAEGNLAVIDLDPVEMANSLDNIRGELPELIEDFDADRFVLDSVSLLEMMYDDVSKRRTEVFDFTQSLKDAGVTTVFTSEANDDNPYASRHGIIEYLTDAVVLLRYVRSETQETRLAVEIQKIRNANHSRETKPYEITMDGISVYEQANIF